MNTFFNQYEGSEKRVYFILNSSQPGLRVNINERWNRVVRASKAKIISKISNKYIDAYILSESSLFVRNDRILMITCGRTILIRAVIEILGIVGKKSVALVLYERKNSLFPSEQPSSFEDDLISMKQLFPGKSCRLGSAGYDHLHLFYSSANTPSISNITLKLFMHELDPYVMELFSRTNSYTAVQIGNITGLNRICPEMITDSYLFSPPGYSLNGISETNYFTVHVTPQPYGSYASFETDIADHRFFNVIHEVISIFKPEKFSFVLQTGMIDNYFLLDSIVENQIKGYNIIEKNRYEFDCYCAACFINYVRISKGGYFYEH